MVQWGTKTARYWEDREEAGQALAEKLVGYSSEETVVAGLPRGGVVVAAEVARNLEVPLSVILVKKIGHPDNPEYAIAAITEGGKLVSRYAALEEVDRGWLNRQYKKAVAEIKRRLEFYFTGRKPISMAAKKIIIVDDGLATGLTMLAAIKEVRKSTPKEIVVAVPVAPENVVSEIKPEVDRLVCLHVEDEFFSSVSNYYERFEQIEDEEVARLLDEAEGISEQAS